MGKSLLAQYRVIAALVLLTRVIGQPEININAHWRALLVTGWPSLPEPSECRQERTIAWQIWAEYYQESGHDVQAQTAFECLTILEIRPEFYAFRVAELKWQAGNLDEALSIWRMARADAVFAVRCWRAWKLGDTSALLRDCVIAYQLDPGNSTTAAIFGLVVALTPEEREAILTSLSLTHIADDSRLLVALGDYHRTQGRSANAFEAARRALAISPTSPSPHALLGHLLLLEADYSEAEVHLAQTLAGSQHPSAFVTLLYARVLLGLGRTTEAAATAQLALARALRENDVYTATEAREIIGK